MRKLVWRIRLWRVHKPDILQKKHFDFRDEKFIPWINWHPYSWGCLYPKYNFLRITEGVSQIESVNVHWRVGAYNECRDHERYLRICEDFFHHAEKSTCVDIVHIIKSHCL